MYRFANQQEVKELTKWCEKIIKEVQIEVKEYFTFSFNLIGSGGKKLVTQNAEEASLSEENHCIYYYTASKNAILKLDNYVRLLYNKIYKPTKHKRIVDFNQGIDSRLVNDSNMKKLAEVNIYP